MPFFSIITPAYNAEKYIDTTIKSVLNQTFTDWEMIIVDDESTDKTFDKILPYCEADSRIKLIQQKNKKQAGARNTGVRSAIGEWVCFLDSDDYWLPNKLNIQFEYIKSGKADVVYTGGYIFENGTDIKKEYPTIYGHYSSTEMYKKLYKENPVPVQSAAIRISVVKNAGEQDERLEVVGCEDYDYWIRLANIGASFYGINSYEFMYRMHTSNISKNFFQMRLGMITVMMKNFKKELLTKAQIIYAFHNRFDPLLLSLIKLKKIKQAKELTQEFKKIYPGEYMKINYLFLSLLGKSSYYPIKLINKLNRFFDNRIIKSQN